MLIIKPLSQHEGTWNMIIQYYDTQGTPVNNYYADMLTRYLPVNMKITVASAPNSNTQEASLSL